MCVLGSRRVAGHRGCHWLSLVAVVVDGWWVGGLLDLAVILCKRRPVIVAGVVLLLLLSRTRERYVTINGEKDRRFCGAAVLSSRWKRLRFERYLAVGANAGNNRIKGWLLFVEVARWFL